MTSTPREFRVEVNDGPGTIRHALKRDDGEHGAPESLRNAAQINEQTHDNTPGPNFSRVRNAKFAERLDQW
ncbi:hypothetical protein [Mycobacterium sp.]|uniref:hypothetical protein n=1 Tax=Mycobacterium sp. TaxID=1785 RepID=UPI003F97829E